MPLKHQELRARATAPRRRRNASRTAERKAALLALLVLIFSGSVIVFHDYFCQEHDEHLHEICSPLHSAYEFPEPFAAVAAFAGCPSGTFPAMTAEGVPLSGFTANIFHPPDLSA